jgi:hypothetical protein
MTKDPPRTPLPDPLGALRETRRAERVTPSRGDRFMDDDAFLSTR